MGWWPSPRVALETAVGNLVFLIGVSVAFESVALGLFFVVGSCLVVPSTRSRLTAKADIDVPRLLLVGIVLASLVAPSLVFDSYETGTYFGTERDVTVRVTCDGEWVGEIRGPNSFRRIDGTGNETIPVPDNDRTIEAFAEKTNGTAGELTIAILLGDDVVASDTATDGEARAEVEYSIGLFED